VDDLVFEQGAWSAADLARFRDLYESAFPPEERDDTDKLVEGLLDGSRPCLAARKAGDLAGFAVYSVLGETRIAFLEYLAVRPELRNQGIGAQLLQEFKRRIGERVPSMRGIVFEVDPPDDATGAEAQLRARRIAFYERNGATLVTELPRLVVPNLAGPGTLSMLMMWIGFSPAPVTLKGAPLRECIEALFVHGYWLDPADPLIQQNLRAIAEARVP
jgi:ribosomal protein S18 acetylase RimI-like enzyme